MLFAVIKKATKNSLLPVFFLCNISFLIFLYVPFKVCKVCKEVAENSCDVLNSSYYVKLVLLFSFHFLFVFSLAHKMTTKKYLIALSTLKFLNTFLGRRVLLPVRMQKKIVTLYDLF